MTVILNWTSRVTRAVLSPAAQVLAHAWFERIKAGETFSDIATTDNTSKRRIQQLVGLTFLAPDIVWDVLDGQQPLGFTSEWCLRHDLPSAWTLQRQLRATL
ncbi:hypothetical protein [Roseovarius pacificus]|uniref:hypothetical protein n=1 Tax=Roseovarius pacificus TaxID=337701 RepID=UPI002A18BA92|nr:hypothetical protein [Roseovarius pacificus]